MMESQRLKALQRYAILDTAPEPAFDDLAELAAQTCNTSIAIIGFFDHRRQWVKSAIGIDLKEIPRKESLCLRTLQQSGVFTVNRESEKPWFQKHFLTRSPYSIQFYAGVPVMSPEGYALGTLAVMDRQSRRLTRRQAKSLQILSRQIASQMELRRNVAEFQIALQEQKRAEDKLRQAEEKYHAIFDNVVEGIYQTTPDGHYLSANQMLARIYGYTNPEELMHAINRIDRQLYVDPQRRQEFVAMLNQYNTISSFESQIYRKDHSIIWISENARSVRGSDGRLKYYEGTVEDISDRKMAEEAMRNSNALYHSLVENIPQNVFRKDLQERFTFANKKFRELLGYSLEEILGKTDYDFFPPDLAAKYQKDDRMVLQTLKPFETIEEYSHPKRGKLYSQVIKTPLYDARGNVIGIQGIFWDVTERKKTEEALNFERELHQTLMDSSPDRIFYKDINSRFIKASRALLDYLGLKDHSEIVGKSVADFYPPERAEESLRDEQHVLRTGQPLINKVERQITPDGRPSWISVTKFPIWNPSGEITGLIGLVRDITQIKEAEVEMSRARDAALESARIKSEFLANVSHEIRTPMNAVIGMASLLLDSPLDDEQGWFAQTILNNAEGLLSIVNDILDFSKMEAGKLRLESLDFNLEDLIQDSIEIFAEKAYAKGLELISFLHPRTPILLQGDPSRLRQILINLLNNAIKFTEYGEVVLEVQRQQESKNKASLLFEVKDTGIGIPDHIIPLLFQAFTQADGSMARKYGGTGLGLAIVKDLVKLMGGEVGLRSQTEQGSVFWCRIPFQKQAKSQTVADHHASPRIRNLMIVSEHDRLRQILQTELGAILPVTGADPQNTHAQLQKNELPENLDVVLFDFKPEVVSHRNLIREFRHHFPKDRLKILLLTPLTSFVLPRELADWIDGRLTKPLSLSRLFQVLEDSSKGPRAGRALLPIRRPVGALEEIRPMRILLAEDNPINTDLAVRQLHKLGFQADAAANGIEVLERLEKTNYDVLLMDCQMPEMDGYTATRLIREMENRQSEKRSDGSLYIIAMTANALEGDRERCLEAGMDDYLPKPVRLPELQSVLKRAAERGRGGSVTPASAPPPRETDDLEELPILDSEVIEGLRQLGSDAHADALGEMTELFCSDTDERLGKLTRALENEDRNSALSLAHSLKGSASNFGARRLAVRFRRLEEALRASNIANSSPGLLREIQAEYASVKDELARLTRA